MAFPPYSGGRDAKDTCDADATEQITGEESELGETDAKVGDIGEGVGSQQGTGGGTEHGNEGQDCENEVASP